MAAEKMEKVLIEAKDKLIDLGIAEQLVSEIEWCLGSYAHDQNPVGLYQKGEEAYATLEDYKKSNARKVPKKLLEDLSKALKSQ